MRAFRPKGKRITEEVSRENCNGGNPNGASYARAFLAMGPLASNGNAYAPAFAHAYASAYSAGRARLQPGFGYGRYHRLYAGPHVVPRGSGLLHPLGWYLGAFAARIPYVASIPMTIQAQALAGMPPNGLTLFGRGNRPRGPWLGYAMRAEQARAGDWIWYGPAASSPANWRRSLNEGVALAQRIGAAGVLMNPEGEGHTRTTMVTLMAGCADAASTVRVGVSINGGARSHVEAMARAGRGKVWLAPQLYYDAANNADFWRKVVNAFGLGRAIPIFATGDGLAGPDSEDATGATAAAYDRYLDSIPVTNGAMLFGGISRVGDPHELQLIERRFGLPGGAMMVPFVLLSVAKAPISIAAIFAVIAILALLFFFRSR